MYFLTYNMSANIPSIYDFPIGYTNFEEIKKKAFEILKNGTYLNTFLGTIEINTN